MKRFKKLPGFTLIELLVVISIISLLAALVTTQVGTVRAKARDSKRQNDFQAISSALQLFFDASGRMPNNYNPCCGATEGDGYYEQSMNELVNAKLLGAPPKSPTNTVGIKYTYYNYGPGPAPAPGAIMVTNLESYPPSTTGIAGSCRPWALGQNWCDASNSTQYCVCTNY